MPLLDTAQLTAIAAGTPELLLPILDDFHATTREALGRLRDTLDGGHIRQAAAEFHQLKGASGTLGLAAFHQRCAHFESQAAQAGPIDPAAPDELLDLLAASVRTAREFLRQPPDRP